MAAAAGTDACITPVLTLEEMATDAHLLARAVLRTVEGSKQPAPAPRFSRSPATVPSPPPIPGEHTLDILRD